MHRSSSAWRLAVAAGLGWFAAPGGAAAQAPQFRDRIFHIAATELYEHQDIARGETSRLEPFETLEWIDAVAGKIAWVGDPWACGVSLVYLPGRNNAGKVDCRPQRTGTESNWNERESTSTFQTSARLDGNVLTLHGELSGMHRFKINSCGMFDSSVSRMTVVQDLRMRIAGETCQVLDMKVVTTEDKVGTAGGRPTHDITRTIRTLPTPASCKIARRSDIADPGLPLRDPSVGC